MKAMILAAGRGSRMQGLTDTIPKPLLKVGGRTLIEHSISSCVRAGITDVVINVSYLADQIEHYLGDGDRFGASIQYSDEREAVQGTGGAVIKALPMLGEDPFLLLSADVVTDFDLLRLSALSNNSLAKLILVNNPEHHPQGDFSLQGGRVGFFSPRFTYANIGLFSPELFRGQLQRVVGLAELITEAIQDEAVEGQFYNGHWFNVGTPTLLESLNARAGIPNLGGCPKKRR